jgi:DNA-binding IclR family transcriptional regulator
MKDSISGVGTLDKAIRVLEALAPEPLSLAGLVEATRLSRPTAHRLARALEAHRLVRRDPEGRFALGLRLWTLGQRALEAIPIAAIALPALEQLRDATGESVQLYVRDGERRLCVAALESPHGLRTIVDVGAALPLDVGSAGVVLADGGGGHRAHGAAGPGWTESVGERQAGVASASAPVRDADDSVIAAVSVSGPIERTSRQPGRRYGRALLRAARRIERDTRLEH